MDYPVDDMLNILDSWMRVFQCEIDVDPYGGLHKIHLYTSRNGNRYQVGADQRDDLWDVYQFIPDGREWKVRLFSKGNPTQDALFALTELWQLADDAITIGRE